MTSYNISDTITTRKGNILTVIDKIGRDLFVTCNVCDKDAEMFPYPFKTCAGTLNKGGVPCGCGSKRLDERQHALRCKRLVEDKGYVFIGFSEPYKGSKTKLELYNPTNNNTWHNALYSGILRGEGCPKESSLRGSIKRSTSFPDFLEKLSKIEKVKDYYTITEMDDRKYCNIFCPVCAEDVMTKNGLCDGNFVTRKAYLLKGWLPCRCSTSVKYTFPQKEFKVKQKVEQVGGEFISLGDDRTSVKYICKNNHEVNVHYNSFVNDNDGCRSCYNLYNRFLGLYKNDLDRDDNLYLLRLSSEHESFIKVGRTFYLDKRLKSYEDAGYSIDTFVLLEDNHENIFDLEQSIFEKFKEYHYRPLTYFKGCVGECLEYEKFNDILDFIDGV